MSDERSEEQAPSVFGNLPAARPGSRSPRRGAGTGAAGLPTPEPPGDPGPRATAAPRPAPAEPEPADEDPAGGGPGGLEDLAWAGVAAAAEAATLGVRLTTRAVEALRDAASRR